MEELKQFYFEDFKTHLSTSAPERVSQDRSLDSDTVWGREPQGMDQLCGGIFQKHPMRDSVYIFLAPWHALLSAHAGFLS